MEINTKLKAFVRENGIKQTFLAKETGIPQQAISAILKDERRIEATEYFAICKALKIRPTYLFEEYGCTSQVDQDRRSA